MASSDLSAELECSVCLDIYTDPVMLRCGHNFCRVCIDGVLDTQERSGGYSCPECRDKFTDRFALQRNITLRNIVENWRGPRSSVVTVWTILYWLFRLVCKVRSLFVINMETRKCSVHKKILEYYCTDDDSCVCVSCCLIGGHSGHKMKSLDDACGKKKTKLRNVLQELLIKREKMEERVQSLQEHRRKVEDKSPGDTETITAMFRDLRRCLDDLEKRVLGEMSGRAERVSRSVLDLIQELEIKKDKMSRKMEDIVKLCNMTDPLTVLQESDTGDLCDTEDGDDEDRHDNVLHDGGGLDVTGVLHTLSDIIRGVNVYFYIQGAEDISLDGNTAGGELQISDDGKSASRADTDQSHPHTAERFQYPQVISSQCFSSGRHYWDVDVGGSDGWIVGVCYPSIERRWGMSLIGYNKKSWGLFWYNNQYSVIHDSEGIPLPAGISSNRVRIFLDYEAGRISFYDLCDPIRHLHTITTTFTEPLHAGVGVWEGCIKICGESV